MTTQPDRQSTSQQACDELDVSRQTLQSYVKKGAPHSGGKPGKPNLFDVAELAAWMQAQGLTGESGHKAEPTSLNDARLRKELAMAHNWELRNAELERRLIDVDLHLSLITRLATTAVSRLAGLPASIAPSLVGLGAGEIQTELEAQINAVRSDLSDSSRYRSDD